MCQALQCSVHAPPCRHLQDQAANLPQILSSESRSGSHSRRGATEASKALGPGDLAPIHLQHLGASGLHYLTTVINLSINSTKIPTRWKEECIIPLLKPGKPADQGKSYRPIALLSPVAKLVEKLLLQCLQEHLPLANHQHGFRSGYSTTTALNCVTHKTSTGLNHPKPCERTVLVALDLMSAFNTVSHEVLLGDIYNTNAPNYIKKWLPPTSMEDPLGQCPGGKIFKNLRYYNKPTKQKGLRAFLGNTNYYHRFILTLARWVGLLFNALKKGTTWFI